MSSQEYRLGPEDLIDVFVWKEPDLSTTVAVRPDGKISLPLANELQAAGTRGASLLAGAPSVKMLGQWVDVAAEIAELPMLSAHADCDELMRWLKGFKRPPKRTFVTHGEPHASAALHDRIVSELGWDCMVPAPLDRVELT